MVYFSVRLDETLNLNNKLDQSVRKKEENIRTLEKTLQANEQRYEMAKWLLADFLIILTDAKIWSLKFNTASE